MGRKTWDSLPKPLVDRYSFILTRNTDLIEKYPFKGLFCNSFFYVNEEMVRNIGTNNIFDVNVIGGSEICDLFFNDSRLGFDKLNITHVQCDFTVNIENAKSISIPTNYKLNKYSEKQHCIDSISGEFVNLRFLEYVFSNKTSPNYETVYLGLMNRILNEGVLRKDRTNVGTLSIFGAQIEFDISETVPVLTTKHVPWKQCIEELLWFLRGDTDAKILQKKNIKIWNGNTSREFLDSVGLSDYNEGVLGPGYGWQWRHFGGEYKQEYADSSNIPVNSNIGFDQINFLIHEIKNNPYSRRLVLSSWNPNVFDQVALVPCHYTCQFYVENCKLSCHTILRSNDMFLGAPWNMFSYAVLTYILAIKCDLKPGKIVYTVSDAHIYKNHIDQVNTLLETQQNVDPVLYMDPSIKYKDFKDMTITDFDLVGYFPHKSVPAKMAI
jgi:thymidylate synthase